MRHSILIVDDEKDMVALLRDNFTMLGYLVLTAAGCDEAVEKAARGPDIILLDVNMPGRDGLDVCRAIRQFVRCPILFLTARVTDTDKIAGFAAGGDDYVTKPFSLAILRARVQTLLRRARPMPSAVELPPFSFDFQNLTFTRNGVPLELSKTEQRLLRLLVEGRGRTLTRAQLLDQVWDGGEFVDENALSVAVKRLRDKLVDAPIRTVYGLGYTWEGAK